MILDMLIGKPQADSVRSPSARLMEAFGSEATLAGPKVNEEKALSLPAVFQAVNLLASHVAMLPVHVFERIDESTKRRDATHPLNQIVGLEPNRDMTAMSFKRAIHSHILLWGNGYAEIRRTQGRVTSIVPIEPDTITKVERGAGGDLVYFFREEGGQEFDLPGSSLLHISGLGLDGIMGYGLIRQMARQNIGLSLAMSEYAQAFFGNGTTMGTVFTTPANLEQEQIDETLAAIRKAHGGTGKAFKPMILDGDLKPVQTAMTNKDAQTIEQLTFSIQDIARWLNVPPPLLMDLSRATFSNITELSAGYVRYSLLPWLKTWEQELTRKLFTPSERKTRFFEFNVDALLRADIEKRYNSYGKGITNGFLTRNEARGMENLNPIDGLDEPLVPLNMGRDSEESDAGSVADLLAESHAGVLADALERMDRKQEKAQERAKKKPGSGYAEWLPGFRAEHNKIVRLAIIPAIEGYAEALRKVAGVEISDADTFEFAKELAERHVGRIAFGGLDSNTIALVELRRFNERIK